MSDANRAILSSYHANVLKEMAEAAGIDITHNGKPLGKDALAARLETTYFSKERVAASYARLGDLEKDVLNRLLLQGGSVSTKRFRRELLRAGIVTEGQVSEHGRAAQRIPYASGYIGLPVPADSRVFEDVVARLTYHGLVFSLRHPYSPQVYKLQYHPDHVLSVPESIRPYLPEPVPVSSPWKDWQPVQVYEEDPAVLLRDLYLYWDFVRRNEVPVLKSGLVAKRALKTINQALVVADRSVEDAQDEREAGRLYQLRRLLEGLGLLRMEKGRLQTKGETPLGIPAFWGLSLAEQVGQCLEAWRGFADLQSMCFGRSNVYDARAAGGLRVFLEVLGKRPPGEWRSAAELLEDIWDHDVNFLIPGRAAVEQHRGRGPYYYSSGLTYYYGDPAQFLKDFAEIEARFVVSCVVSILLPLGLVELGRDARHDDDPNNWHAFRLTPLGCTVLCGVSGKVVCETDTGKVVVQPNFQIMALGPVGVEVLARLDLFAERKRAERGAVEYQLSRQSVYQAQQAGMSVDEIVGFLEAVSASELPQNVRRSLEEWASHHNRIVFRRGVTLVQAAGQEMLDGLLQDATTGKLLSRHLAGDIALVQPERNSELIATLLERGLLPMVSGADRESADRSVSIDGDGTIHSGHAVPNLHLRGRLMRVAEEKGDGTWQLTPTSVRRAGGSREKVQQMLDDLGRLQRGVLPEDLAQQIKVWGGYYGQAASETLTLIEFNEPQTLAELGEHPDLKGLLTPFAAGDRPLAVVPAGRVMEVRKVLAGLGVEISDTLPC